MSVKKIALAAMSTACIARIRFAAIVYEEAIIGDLSSNQNSPTAIGSLFTGPHNIRGTVTDRDFWTITIPADHLVTSIFVDSFTSTDNQGFFAIRGGVGFSYLTDASTLLGRTFNGGATVRNPGDDILVYLSQNNSPNPRLGTPSHFTPPLGQGTYSFWIQENGSSMTYDLRFNVVPEPSSLALLVATGVGIALLRRKR